MAAPMARLKASGKQMKKQGALAVVVLFIIVIALLLGFLGLGSPLALFGL